MAKRGMSEWARKERELWRLFRRSPEVSVAGVVGASEPGGGRSQGDKLWSLHLQLEAWREIGGPLIRLPMIVTARVTEAELRSLMKRIRAHSVIAFRGKVVLNSPQGTPRAELCELLPRYKDAELQRFLVEYKKPVKMRDAKFGTLTLDRRFGWFEGKGVWAGRRVRLTVCASEPAQVAAALGTARSLWSAMKTWKRKVDDYAVARLLEPKNAHWLGEGESEVTPAGFKKAMRLEAVRVYPDGRFEFWHDDGGLFWGHAIQVSGNLKEGITDIDTPG